MPSRRSFMSLLAGGSVLGPQLVNAATDPMRHLNPVVGGISKEPGPQWKNGLTAGGHSHSLTEAPPEYYAKEIVQLRKRIAALPGMFNTDVQNRMQGLQKHALDPDIAALRSFSGMAKLRLQAERETRRYHEYQREDLLSQIEHAMKSPGVATLVAVMEAVS